MKKLWILAALFLTIIQLQGQNVTKSFTWQGIIKDDVGKAIENQTIDMQISIHSGIATGAVIYRESHEVTTSSTGHVALEIGKGQATEGTFESIDWTANNYFQEVGIDTVGNGSFQTIGTTPIRPIPLAIDVLNKNESIHVVNAESGRYIDLEEKDIVHVEGDISVTDEMRFYDQYLYIYGGNFTGTTGNDELRFGNYTIIKNAHFNNIKLDGNWLTFENCHFSGDIEFPHDAILTNCDLLGVTGSTITRIGTLQNSTMNGSTIRADRVANCNIDNSTVSAGTIISCNIGGSTISGVSQFANNDVHQCKIDAMGLITNNQCSYTKVTIPSNASFGLTISDNVFENVYSNESEVIKVDVNSNYLKLCKIVDNVFRVQSSTSRSIYVVGNTTTLPLLDISNNMFYQGGRAIWYSSNIKTFVTNNKTSGTSLGVATGGNLRVYYNLAL